MQPACCEKPLEVDLVGYVTGEDEAGCIGAEECQVQLAQQRLSLIAHEGWPALGAVAGAIQHTAKCVGSGEENDQGNACRGMDRQLLVRKRLPLDHWKHLPGAVEESIGRSSEHQRLFKAQHH